MPTMAPVCMASRQASRRSFSRNGSPTCTLGRFCLDSSVNSAEAMEAGTGAYVDDGIADSGGPRIANLLLPANPQGEDVYQRIAVVTGFKETFAADRRNAEAVSVMGDARNHTLKDAPVADARHRIIQAAEAQRIEDGNRSGAHGKNVAQNPTHAGGRTLKRLDETRVVVGFDLEGDDVAFADIDDAGVFTGPLYDPIAACGQLLQVQARAFVRAMLAPHDAENT